MDCSKVGNLIYRLRREQGLTQRALAQRLNISDKTVSKWERGLGCPDVSLLRGLSQALGVNMEKLLSGDLESNRADGGDMKKLKFYVCPSCGSLVTATGEAEISCCGRKLPALTPQPADEDHRLHTELVEDDCYITFSHPMEKDHYINFVACVTYDRVLLVHLYPEQGGEVRLPQLRRGKLYFCCSRHGLFVNE